MLSASKPIIVSASFAPEAAASGAAAALAPLVAVELERPPSPALAPMVGAIRRRHGAAVAAVIFYGSCLRTGAVEDGVLDFYVLVDSYRRAYGSGLLAVANAILPPNVFYLEVCDGGRTLRAKYAVLSTEDFQRGTASRWMQTIIWARFCQPAQLMYVRDATAAATVVAATAEAVVTMVRWAAALLPAEPFRSVDLWRRGFSETYGAELRVESAAVVDRIYAAAADRYDQVAEAGLGVLAARGELSVSRRGDIFDVGMAPARRRRLRRRWRVRRILGKPLAALRLIKSMATFGDWLPYALWKLERHTGVRIEMTPWQRRHPWIACWPVIARLLIGRVLR